MYQHEVRLQVLVGCVPDSLFLLVTLPHGGAKLSLFKIQFIVQTNQTKAWLVAYTQATFVEVRLIGQTQYLHRLGVFPMMLLPRVACDT